MTTPKDIREIIEKIKEARFDHAAVGSTRVPRHDRDPDNADLDTIFMTTIDGQKIMFSFTTSEGPDLKRKVPSIGIFVDKGNLRNAARSGDAVIELTWDEARQFCKHLLDVTDTAEYG